MTQPTPPTPTPRTSRRPLFIVGGLALLGAALALLLFGGDLFADRDGVIPGRVPDSAFDFSQPAASNSEGIAVEPDGALEVGDPAPDFTLTDLDGDAVSLSDFAGRPVIVNFWATWCAPCRLEMPGLQNVFEARQDDGLAILAVNVLEEPEQVREFFYDELELTFIPLLDPEGEAVQAYGVGRFMPTTYFVDGDGRITVVHRGLMTEGQIEAFVDQTVGDGRS